MTKYTDFINYNLSMLTDFARVEAYQTAIKKVVRPGDVVVDLGTGSGILALLACQAGAKRVYAIESEKVIHIAMQVCRRNRLEDRVVFLNEISFQVELPQRVDVVVTETMGTFGPEEGLVGSIIDARDRFLKPSGALIPRVLELFLVPVEVPGFYEHMIDFWTSDQFGVDFSPMRQLAMNNFHPIKLHPEAFLCDPVSLVRVNLATATTSEIRSEVSFYTKRRGKVFGLAGWFAVDLTEGHRLSNAPGSPTSHWGIAFFPLARPVVVERGNRIRTVIASQSNGAVWTWQANVHGEQFQHSTLWGFPQAERDLHKFSPEAAPKLSAKGEVELALLGMMNGALTLQELQAELRRRYSHLFKTEEQAAAFVQEIVRRCA